MVRYEITISHRTNRCQITIEGHMANARDCNALSGVVQSLLTYAQNNLSLNMIANEKGFISFACDTNTQLVNTLVDYLRLNGVRGDIRYE